MGQWVGAREELRVMGIDEREEMSLTGRVRRAFGVGTKATLDDHVMTSGGLAGG